MKRRFMIIPVFLIIAALLFSAVWGESTPTPPKPGPKLVIDPNIGATPTPAPTDPPIAIPGWGGIRLKANSDTSEVALYNPADNEGWYYLTYSLTLADTGEELFTTGLIPPDMYCTMVTLQRQLAPGSYRGHMFVQPYRINDDLTPTNNAEYEIEILVD